MDSIYCSDQIEVPAALPGILKAYSKEVIRYQPADIPGFSRDYFTALAQGQAALQTWLNDQAKLKAEIEKAKAEAAVIPQ